MTMDGIGIYCRSVAVGRSQSVGRIWEKNLNLFLKKMRMLIKRLVSTHNISFVRLSALRFSSSDAQKKPEEAAKGEDKPDDIKKNIVVEKYGGITTINIDRQKTRNSLDEDTLREMEVAIDAFDKDDEAKVLVFNGEGGSFCSGLFGGRRLTSLIGLSQALDLLMTGRLISGVEANQKGLAAKVTATGTGIGKHGKFYKLTEVPLQDWELENSVEETVVKLGDDEKAPDGKAPK
ncbi:hypothetical protein MSG28_013757 [Choristoneura fumiferana]|uniref:Uncharacterized protein n=1 Tax=Choristoneura fumiferana TaxID=7141 RepID=A0ACC0K9U9_CHOFU|nr:hypothetical protein MSG28_013757 [Choristoneura fumiferana]